MSKYGAKPTEVDGIRFASRMEARRYQELRLMESAGVIRDLVLQPSWDLTVNGTNVARYVADFAYWDNERNVAVTEDCKGFRTPAYRMKRKLMKAIYGIDILETTA
jgi:hypothetical protein